MGTRAIVRVYEEGDKNEIVCIYRQHDGYPSGLGNELAAFLAPIRMVNGIRNTDATVANGAGCLAAQIVAYLKDSAGSVYMRAPGTNDVGEEYTYKITAKDSGILFECQDAYNESRGFSGTPEEFDGEEFEGED